MYEVILLANMLVWLGIAFYYARLPHASVYHPVSYYLFFHGFVFTFRPFIAYLGDYNFIYKTYQFTPSIDDKVTVILGTMLGLICFVTTALWVGNAPLRFKQDRCTERERDQLKKPFLFVAAVLAPLGTIGVAVAFYLGFKNNQSYDRFWEARTIWGGIVNSSTCRR